VKGPHTIRETIRLNNLYGLVDDVGHVDLFRKFSVSILAVFMPSRLTHTDNLCCASLCSKHGQDTRPAPYVKYSLAFEEVGVVVHCVAVRCRPDRILEHLLVDACSFASKRSLSQRMLANTRVTTYRNGHRNPHSCMCTDRKRGAKATVELRTPQKKCTPIQKKKASNALVFGR